MNMMKVREAALYAVVALGAALAGFGAVYATRGGSDNGSAAIPSTPAPLKVAAGPAELPKGPGSNALSQGQMAGFVWKREPEALSEFTFLDGTGASKSLADWRGKVVLLNLWATWCAPCRKEMPSLERLQKDLGSNAFEVVALSVDRAGVDASRKFLDQIKVSALGLYVDPTARASSSLKAIGMPTTLLLDKQGRELGRLVGPAEWDGEDAKRLVTAALGAP